MEIRYANVGDDLPVNHEKTNKAERVKLFVTLSGYLFSINKPIGIPTKSEANKIKTYKSFLSLAA